MATLIAELDAEEAKRKKELAQKLPSKRNLEEAEQAERELEEKRGQ